jgi:hypothetical protein
MSRYSFLIDVNGVDTKADAYEDPFYQSGCSDALIAVFNGHLRLDFQRSAPTFDRAVASAVKDIQRAGGRIMEVHRVGD